MVVLRWRRHIASKLNDDILTHQILMKPQNFEAKDIDSYRTTIIFLGRNVVVFVFNPIVLRVGDC